MRIFKTATVALVGLLAGVTGLSVAQAQEAGETASEPAPPSNAEPAPPPAPPLVAKRSSRVVVIPVTVGNGPKPSDELLAAIGDGMSGNMNLRIDVARSGKPIPVVVLEDFDAEVAQKLEERRVEARSGSSPIEAYERLLTDAEAAMATHPMGQVGRALVIRIVEDLISAVIASGDQQKAKTVAEHVALLFPGHRPTTEEGLSVVASALIGQAAPTAFATIQFLTRPEGCMVEVNGADVGPAPVTVMAAPGVTYHARALCSKDRGGGVSMRKIAVAGLAGEGRSFVLDVQFEKEFINDATGTVMSFGSSNARRELEQVYARRIAEKFSADTVVFVSLGELSGKEHLNARVYLRSGFKNRQGLARPEVSRASALGHYLVSGQDDGSSVLRPEEIAKAPAVDIAVPSVVSQPLVRAPWYTDVPGWLLLGTGALGVVGGRYADSLSQDKLDELVQMRKAGVSDPFEKDRLEGESSRLKFIGNTGLFIGGLMALTGVVLLATPEYRPGQSELIVLSPTFGTGSTGLQAVGRF